VGESPPENVAIRYYTLSFLLLVLNSQFIHHLQNCYSMTTTTIQAPAPVTSKGRLWTGRIITGICVLFLLFDAFMKIIKEHHTIESSAKMGWPVNTLQTLGFVLLLCTILYMVPRTAILGAILLTAYLGGATAVNVMVGFPFIFPVIFAVLVWLGLWLLHAHLRRALR
jgi:hypothetical protein